MYLPVLALIYLALSLRTIRLRWKFRVSVGDGGHKLLQRAIRVHSNFSEYVPLIALLIYLVESSGASGRLVHGLCLALLFGRVLHATAVSQEKEPLIFRQSGMILTFASLIISSVYLLYTRWF